MNAGEKKSMINDIISKQFGESKPKVKPEPSLEKSMNKSVVKAEEKPPRAETAKTLRSIFTVNSVIKKHISHSMADR